MERDNSLQGLEAFSALTLEKARTADVEELDDDGWLVASMEKRIIEIGSLGEGAGGAVMKCKLKGGKTTFALKASYEKKSCCRRHEADISARSLLLIQTQM